MSVYNVYVRVFVNCHDGPGQDKCYGRCMSPTSVNLVEELVVHVQHVDMDGSFNPFSGHPNENTDPLRAIISNKISGQAFTFLLDAMGRTFGCIPRNSPVLSKSTSSRILERQSRGEISRDLRSPSRADNWP